MILQDLPGVDDVHVLSDRADLSKYAALFGTFGLGLVSTSIEGSLEISATRQFLGQRVPVACVLDHWGEFERRFEPSALPDLLFVPDDVCADELARWGAPVNRLRSHGHPALDGLVNKKELFDFDRESRLRASLGLSEGQAFAVFVSEPCSEDHGGGALDGYEFRVLDFLLEGWRDSKMSLFVKLHPREQQAKYDALLAGHGPLVKVVAPTVDRYDLVLAARLVIGIDSMLVIEAAYLGLPAYTVNLGGTDTIPARLGLAKPISDERELRNAVLMPQGSRTLSNRNAVGAIVDDILAFVKDRQ